MKGIIIPILLSIASTSSIAFNYSKKETKILNAGIPTTIDLNDVSEQKIREYYADIDEYSESERQGTNLLKNLKPILRKGQNCYSYGSSATKQVWQAYEIIDRDWKLSPASEIAGYDAKTNKITGYKYGSSSSDVGSNPYIHALYVNRDAENQTRAWGDHSQTNYGINQEHVWPKSAGFDDDDYPEGARGDLMHLWAGNGRVNGQYHSNWYYGYVDKTKSYTDAGDDYAYLKGNLKGKSKTFGGNNDVFEPQDSDKGDIARTIFYMMARYNYLANDGDTINASNPNLEIVNNVTSFQKAGYTSSKGETGKLGILQDLLEWNKLDPVDSFEIHRNNLLFNNYSFNRNPFIDFPEWADYIWGVSSSGTYSPTPTGSASPKQDKIATGNEAPIIPNDNDSKPATNIDWKWIVIIAAVAVVVAVILIIIFVNLSKKNQKKVVKTAKKAMKKSNSNSKKKK